VGVEAATEAVLHAMPGKAKPYLASPLPALPMDNEDVGVGWDSLFL
jgi:hypothetical protein